MCPLGFQISFVNIPFKSKRKRKTELHSLDLFKLLFVFFPEFKIKIFIIILYRKVLKECIKR